MLFASLIHIDYRAKTEDRILGTQATSDVHCTFTGANCSICIVVVLCQYDIEHVLHAHLVLVVGRTPRLVLEAHQTIGAFVCT